MDIRLGSKNCLDRSYRICEEFRKRKYGPLRKSSRFSCYETLLISFLMPYLHWATSGPKFDHRNAVIKKLAEDFKDPDYQRPSCEEIRNTEVSPKMQVLRAFLHPAKDSCLHIRRTLDQYYYSTVDADERTEDQVVYKFAKKQHNRIIEEDKKAEIRRRKKEEERLEERERERNLRERKGSRGGSSMEFEVVEVEYNTDSDEESENPYRKRREPPWDPPKVMMVNQLWMWIIDGGGAHVLCG